MNRLADDQDLVEQFLNETTAQVSDLLPTVRIRNGKEEVLPPLGEVLAIDGSVLPSYGNGNHPTGDVDAAWGYKHKGRAKGGKEMLYGYAMHLVSDAVHGVPLAFTLTAANGSEYKQFPIVVGKTLRPSPGCVPGI